jgi:hypothetical protein
LRRPTTVTGASAATTSAAGPSRPTSSYVNGTVDEVAIYSRARSTQEVADHYNRAK